MVEEGVVCGVSVVWCEGVYGFFACLPSFRGLLAGLPSSSLLAGSRSLPLSSSFVCPSVIIIALIVGNNRVLLPRARSAAVALIRVACDSRAV